MIDAASMSNVFFISLTNGSQDLLSSRQTSSAIYMATTPITSEPGRERVLLDLERCNEEKIVAKIRAKKSD
jgi:hypothetical protein